MKKTLKIAVIFIIVICSVSTKAFANDIDLDELKNQIINQTELENAITGTSKDLIEDVNISINTNIADDAISIYNKSKNYVSEILRNSINTLIKIFILVVISSMTIGFVSANDLKSINNYINMATSVGISSIILLDVKNVLMMCSKAIDEIEIFSQVLMPTMVTALTFSGAPTVAVITQTSSMFVLSLVIGLIKNVFFPLVYLYIGIITVNSAVENDSLSKISGFIKWITTTSLRTIIMIFLTYMSLTGIVSGTVDGFAIKSAKFASSFIPVVGNIISDASETILVGASIIKNSIGIFGIFAIISICLIPFLQIIINLLMFKIFTVILSPISSKQVSKLLDGITQTFNMSFAMLSSTALVMFIMIIVGIMVVRQI